MKKADSYRRRPDGGGEPEFASRPPPAGVAVFGRSGRETTPPFPGAVVLRRRSGRTPWPTGRVATGRNRRRRSAPSGGIAVRCRGRTRRGSSLIRCRLFAVDQDNPASFLLFPVGQSFETMGPIEQFMPRIVGPSAVGELPEPFRIFPKQIAFAAHQSQKRRRFRRGSKARFPVQRGWPDGSKRDGVRPRAFYGVSRR